MPQFAPIGNVESSHAIFLIYFPDRAFSSAPISQNAPSCRTLIAAPNRETEDTTEEVYTTEEVDTKEEVDTTEEVDTMAEDICIGGRRGADRRKEDRRKKDECPPRRKRDFWRSAVDWKRKRKPKSKRKVGEDTIEGGGMPADIDQKTKNVVLTFSYSVYFHA